MASLQTRLSDLITAIGTDYKTIKGWVGDLTSLTTTEKGSLVGAINEVFGATGSAPDASETVKGLVELATLVEVGTGTDTVRAVTPAGVRQERTALKDEILGSGVPEALDTLKELADALSDEDDAVAALTTVVSGKQPLDDDLTAIAGLASDVNKVPYSTGEGTWSLADFTAAGRALVDDADAAAQRATLSVYSQSELGDPDTNLVTLYTAAKT